MYEDSQQRMAKVTYATGIDTVSGSLAKPKKKNGQHKCGNYLIGTHRVAATQSSDCSRLYVRKADTYERTTPVSAEELAARARFTAVKAMVKARSEDLTKLAADQAAFLAQKDLAGGKKTMNAYYWYVCGQEYDAQH